MITTVLFLSLSAQATSHGVACNHAGSGWAWPRGDAPAGLLGAYVESGLSSAVTPDCDDTDDILVRIEVDGGEADEVEIPFGTLTYRTFVGPVAVEPGDAVKVIWRRLTTVDELDEPTVVAEPGVFEGGPLDVADQPIVAFDPRAEIRVDHAYTFRATVEVDPALDGYLACAELSDGTLLDCGPVQGDEGALEVAANTPAPDEVCVRAFVVNTALERGPADEVCITPEDLRTGCAVAPVGMGWWLVLVGAAGLWRRRG